MPRDYLLDAEELKSNRLLKEILDDILADAVGEMCTQAPESTEHVHAWSRVRAVDAIQQRINNTITAEIAKAEAEAEKGDNDGDITTQRTH